MSTLSINKEKYLRLKERYKKAEETHEEEFGFEGNLLSVSYVKYLLKYLKSIYGGE